MVADAAAQPSWADVLPRLTAEDVEMLRAINYRGRRPETKEDFALLYEVVRRIVT